MSVELQSTFVVGATLLVLLSMQGGLIPVTHGLKWGLGPRDEPRAPTALQGRFSRIIANHIEGMAMFIPLVMIIEFAGLSTGLTAAGAVTFAAARIAFALVYTLGIPVVRTLVWGVGMAGILMMAYPVATGLL